jgi:hypothetical protein
MPYICEVLFVSQELKSWRRYETLSVYPTNVAYKNDTRVCVCVCVCVCVRACVRAQGAQLFQKSRTLLRILAAEE